MVKRFFWPLVAVLFLACTPRIATEIKDCAACPSMIPISAGSFLMGTAPADRMIDPRTGKPAKNDSPQHAVNVSLFALGTYEVTVAQYRAFVEATQYQSSDKCIAFGSRSGRPGTAKVSWDKPGFEQPDDAPVGCVSFYDALAYTEWLSARTGQNYRLPTEAEWEYAARAGTTAPYHWGADELATCRYANVRSTGAPAISQRQADSDANDGFPCDDGAVHSSPVGSYRPNNFGLHDMQGNQWEWVMDCNHKDYNGAPTDGSAWLDAKPCQFGLIRGGSYLNRVERSSTAVRVGRPRSGSATNMGFRVARGNDRQPTGSIGAAPNVAQIPTDYSAGAQLFDENCRACHIDSTNFQGLYGTSLAAVIATISDGGNNVMSMPAFRDTLSASDINELARYLRRVNAWND